MKKQTIKLYAIIAIVGMLISIGCKKIENPEVDSPSYDLTVLNPDQSRITNYWEDSSTNTKSIVDIWVPSPEDIPSDAIEMTSDFQAWQVVANQSYYLPEGVSLSKDIKFDQGVEYYIQGHLIVTNHWGQNGSIYVLETATLSMARLDGENAIVSAGSLDLGNNFAMASQSSLLSVSQINAANIELNQNCEIRLDAPLILSGHLQLNQNSDIYFNSCVTVNSLNVNGGLMHLSNYLYVEGSIEFTSGGTILIEENPAVIECGGTITIQNLNTKIVGLVDGFYSPVVTAILKLHHDDQTANFVGCLDIHADEILTNGSGNPVSWAPSVKFDGETVISAEGCSPGFNSGETAVGEKTLVLLTSLESIDDKISATSICFDTEYSYLSWHQRGDEYKGYIDLLTTNYHSDGSISLTLENTYESDDIDFNHIYAAQNKIYTAGGSAKGALIAEISHSSTSVSIDVTQVAGTSGNCLIEKENNLLVVSGGSSGAYTVYNPTSQNVILTMPLPYAKYVVESNNQPVVLYDIEEEAKIKNIENESNDFIVGEISPTNGKNACFAYGDKLYVSMGFGGLKVFENGIEVKQFQIEGGNAVNCVYVDEDYIYLAYGNSGVYVLDVVDYSIITNYLYTITSSANFITKRDDGLIYVSYGLSGAQVLKLVDAI